MDEEGSSYYKLGGLTEDEQAQRKERVQREISDLTADELTQRIRGKQVELDVLYLDLGATARVIVRILDELIEGVRNVAASLSAIDAPWAQVHEKNFWKLCRRPKSVAAPVKEKYCSTFQSRRTKRLMQSGWAALGW